MENSIIKMQAKGIFISLLEASEIYGERCVTSIFECRPGDHEELFKELRGIAGKNDIFLQGRTVEGARVEVTIIVCQAKSLEGEPF